MSHQSIVPASAFAQLAEVRNQPNPTYWKPNPGDNLSGVIVEVKEVPGFNGVMSKTIIILTESGELYSTWLTAYIEKYLTTNRAQIGDMLSITFKGKDTSGKTSFNRYDLAHVSKLALVEGGNDERV